MQFKYSLEDSQKTWSVYLTDVFICSIKSPQYTDKYVKYIKTKIR